MLVRIERLRSALKLVEPVIPRKTSVPITQSVRIGDGKVLATDLENAAWVDLPEANDTCLLPYKPLSEVLDLVPGHLPLTLECEKKVVRLSWEGGKAAYPTADPRDFPDMVQKDPPVIMEDIDGTPLVSGLVELLPYAATETARPVLNGVTLYCGEKAVLAAADGFRLAYRTLPFAYGAEGAVILPAAAVKIIDHLWKKTPVSVQAKPGLIEQLLAKRMVTLAIGKDSGWVGLRFGTVKLVVKAIVGSPPNHKQLLDGNHPNNKVTFMAPEMYRAVLRCKDIANDASGIVRMKWENDGKIEVYAAAEEMGEISTTVLGLTLDGPGHIAVNYKYLAEYFKGKDGQVTMGINTQDGSPVRFEYSNAPLILVMPMMVAW